MKTTTFLPLLSASGLAFAATHTVMVGGVKPPTDPTAEATPMLQYSPESIMAEPGDMVEFHFMQTNHTVTQSSFEQPCKAMEGGFDSGFMPNPDGADGVTWSMMVNDTKPIWAYCKQKKGIHCGKGMVFSVNAVDSSDKSFTAYKQLAIQQNGTDLDTADIAATPAAAVSSTVTLAAGQAEDTAAAAATATVAAGDGTCADGSACTCSCLCGANSFPDGAAVNNFGGFAGV
ncbi:hypothetical protein SLS58_010977 [Diplodia intermedia]|uniref:Serine-threonine rich n=1 Tax=Diplodia intermedia TaxID=856260 RepID=A0ABR3T2C9_9PEZI